MTTLSSFFTFQHLNTKEELLESARRITVRLLRPLLILHLVFGALAGAEVLAFLALFPLLAKSFFFALLVAAIFLTPFSYLVLRAYLLEKREDEGKKFAEEVIQRARLIPPTIATLRHVATHLDVEGTLAKRLLSSDLEKMQERILIAAIREGGIHVQNEPLHVETHEELFLVFRELISFYERSGHREKRKRAEMLAREELDLLLSLNRDEGHIRLLRADFFRECKDEERELMECERLQHLLPHDRDLLVRIGKLYFTLGRSQDGLKIYFQLRGDPARAHELLRSFGAPSFFEETV